MTCSALGMIYWGALKLNHLIAGNEINLQISLGDEGGADGRWGAEEIAAG